MGVEIPALRRSARGQPCMFMLPGICTGDRSTVVLCHCRIGYFGGASKPDDFSSAAFGCFACHSAIDAHRVEDEARVWLDAIRRTQRIWYEEGLMKFPEAPMRPAKGVSKIVPRPQGFRR